MMSTSKSQRRTPKVLVLGLALFMGALVSGQACAQEAVVDVPLTLKTVFAWLAQNQQMLEDQSTKSADKAVRANADQRGYVRRQAWVQGNVQGT